MKSKVAISLTGAVQCMVEPINWLAFEDNRNADVELLAGAVVGLLLSELILEQWAP